MRRGMMQPGDTELRDEMVTRIMMGRKRLSLERWTEGRDEVCYDGDFLLDFEGDE